jgi:hypothetical protein
MPTSPRKGPDGGIEGRNHGTKILVLIGELASVTTTPAKARIGKASTGHIER